MSANIYAVRIRVKHGTPHYEILPNIKGLYYQDTIVKMKHIEARTQEQACKRASKYGEVLSVNKVDAVSRLKNIENIKLDIYDGINPYPNAIAMDEMIWQKYGKDTKDT